MLLIVVMVAKKWMVILKLGTNTKILSGRIFNLRNDLISRWPDFSVRSVQSHDLDETCGRGDEWCSLVCIWPWYKIKVNDLANRGIPDTYEIWPHPQPGVIFETRDQYKISLGSDFRYRSRVTCYVTPELARKAVTIKLNEVIRLYLIWIELDETYPTI